MSEKENCKGLTINGRAMAASVVVQKFNDKANFYNSTTILNRITKRNDPN